MARVSICAVVILAALAAAAAVGSVMVVPSGGTAGALEAMSHKPNVIADVLTVNRKEYVLHLDGSGGRAFSGQSVSSDSAGATRTEPSTIRIPLEQLALVYYVELPVNAKDTPDHLIKKDYPTLAAVGAAEQGLDCSALDLEIARAGTIRWYVRLRSGAVPFSEHEATVQHAKNAAEDVGLGLLVVMELVAGGGGFPLPFSTPEQEAVRWILTAADRREVGLLQLKHKHLCPADATPRGDTTDLEILTAIESARRALGNHEISDQEQVRQQTQLLDQLDPATSADDLAARATALQRVATAGNAVAVYDGLQVVTPLRAGCDFRHCTAESVVSLEIRERAVLWLPLDRPYSDRVWIDLPIGDIQEVRPPERAHFSWGVGLGWGIPIQKRDGSCVFVAVSRRDGKIPPQELQGEARLLILERIAALTHAREENFPPSRQ